MIKLFLSFELEKIVKYFKTEKLAKLITSFLFLLVFLFVGLGIYFFFVSGFSYINVNLEQSIRLPLTLFFYEIFLLVLTGIIIFSSLVSSVFSLFGGERDNWVISSPNYKIFPKLIFIRSSMISFWPFFVAFLPAILAFNKIYNLNILSLFFIFLSFILLLILLNALTLLAIVIVGFVYYRLARKITLLKFNFKGLIILLLFLVIITISAIWRNIANIDLVKLFKADEKVAIDISGISNYFDFLPTHSFAMEIINWQNGQSGEALVNFSVLLFLAVIFVAVWWRLSHLFYPLWQKFQEGGFQSDPKSNVLSGRKTIYRFEGGRTWALFQKEALTLTRNPKGMLWFLFLSFIWLAQVGTSLILSKNIQTQQLDMSQKSAMLQSLQFIVAIYFICAFTLRFVFPSFSLEKKTAWILASAPLNFKKIFFGKHLFFSLFFVAGLV